MDSTFEMAYFGQQELKNLVEFKKKYFYEFVNHGKALTDYWDFLARFINYYISVISYNFFGIFTCSFHRFETQLKKDIYIQLKVAFKQSEENFPNSTYSELTNEDVLRLWKQSISEKNIDFFVFVMKTLPQINLDEFEPLDEVFFETNIKHPDIKGYLKNQYTIFSTTGVRGGQPLMNFFQRNERNLLSLYEQISYDLQHNHLDQASVDFQTLSRESKDEIWEKIIEASDTACVELIIQHELPTDLKPQYLHFLIKNYFKSEIIRHYLHQNCEKLNYVEADYKFFLGHFFKIHYVPNAYDVDIFKSLLKVAKLESEFSRQLEQLKLNFVTAKKDALLELKPERALSSTYEHLAAFRIILAYKKSALKNNQWDNVLINLSRHQGLKKELTESEKQDLHQCLMEINKFRPLGGMVGPLVKGLTRSSVFSKNLNQLDDQEVQEHHHFSKSSTI